MTKFIDEQREVARAKATIKENPIEDNGELIDGSYAYFYLPDLDTPLEASRH